VGIAIRMHCHGDVNGAHAAMLQAALAVHGIDCVAEDVICIAARVVLLQAPDAALDEQLRTWNALDRTPTIVVGVDQIDSHTAWTLVQAGAADVLIGTQADVIAASLAARFERWREVEALLDSPVVTRNLRGRSAVWREALRSVIEAARFGAAPILIGGESGTGKELVARLIHTLDPRPNKGELVVLDCTTIVGELAGSELFGHERGAFTGAVNARDGALALANGGTLFLDEIGELPLPLQAQLLRAIQERAYKRVGGNQWMPTNFRLVCATNRNLRAEVGSGAFRADLYYRIAGWTCELPPLRERTEDILPLAAHFFKTDSEPSDVFDPLVCDYLLRRDYPGNVRELQQVVETLRARHANRGGVVTVGSLRCHERALNAASTSWRDEHFEAAIRRAMEMGVKLKELSQMAADTAVKVAVQAEEGNLKRAARRLGVTDRALQMRRANGMHRH
jgi:transcriptional regulator with GAF, ATPase, and Fis domain